MKAELIPPRKKVAFKALGGRSRAVAWHFGVLKGLLERGFRTLSGPRGPDTPRADGSTISTFIGSSAGALFSTLAACGFDGVDMLRAIDPRTPDEVLRVPRLTTRMILKKSKQSLGRLWRRFEMDVKFRVGLSTFPPPESGFVNRLKTLALLLYHADTSGLALIRQHTTEGLEAYIREGVTKGIGDRFQNLAPELYIIATNDDVPSSAVFGPKSTPFSEHYYYIDQASVSRACAASMAVPGLFRPVRIGAHHFSDGDMRGPYFNHVAEDADADLIFVSSIYNPHRYVANSPNPYDRVMLSDLGLRPLINQVVSQALHAVRVMSEHERAKKLEAFKVADEMVQDVQDKLRRRSVSEDSIEALHLEGLRERLRWALRTDPDTRIIYIEIPPGEQNLFFSNPFDLSTRMMGEIFIKGYRTAQKILRKYEFS